MRRIETILDKRVCKIKEREILVRDVISLLLVLFIGFVIVLAILRGTGIIKEPKESEIGEVEYAPITNIEDDLKKEEEEEHIRNQARTLTPCELSEMNLDDVDRLLASSDLCNAAWYEALDMYIKRLEIQNEELAKREGSQEIVGVQKKLIARLKGFEKRQNETIVDKLEEVVKEYREVATQVCI